MKDSRSEVKFFYFRNNQLSFPKIDETTSFLLIKLWTVCTMSTKSIRQHIIGNKAGFLQNPPHSPEQKAIKQRLRYKECKALSAVDPQII